MLRVTLAKGPLRTEALGLLAQSSVTDHGTPADSRVDGTEAVFAALDHDEVIGAIRLRIDSAGTANLWLPAIGRTKAADIRDALIRAAVQCADDARAWLTQCLLSECDDRGCELLPHGFVTGATALMMKHGLEPQDVHAADNQLSFHPYVAVGGEPRLSELLEATWQDTLDCPQLAGCRPAVDVLAGHRLVGQHNPDSWQIVRHNDRDVGILLMTHWPDDRTDEIVYMGVLPAERGQGFGSSITQHAINVARDRASQAVQLSVDKSNHFAVRIYTQLGFKVNQRVTVMTRLRTTA